MDAEIKKLLSQEDPEDAFHNALLGHGKRLVAMSKARRRENWDGWDIQEAVFRGELVPDKEDVKKQAEGRPAKVIMPTAYSQIMTFVAYHFLQFTQDDTFFNLKPTGDEDFGQKKADCEATLEFDLRKNEWHTKLFQNLLDIGRFGEGILEVSWTKETMKAWVSRQQPSVETNGISTPTSPISSWEDYVKFEGNRIRNVSPFRFFPDTRFPLVDFQKGEFCAIEEEYSMNQLYNLEAEGEVAGVRFIQPMAQAQQAVDLQSVMAGLRGPLGKTEDLITKFSAGNGSSVTLVTKVQVWIVPSKFKLRNFVPGTNDPVGQHPVKNEKGEWVLGKEDHRVLYHLWYANNNRVIRMEQAKVWHDSFGFVVGQFTPDMHQVLTFGLGELIYAIQELQSWYLNSRVRSVDRVIANRLIVNTQMIETKSLDGDGDIYIKKGVSTPDLGRAIGQLRVQDVTAGHMNDLGLLGEVIEQVTGVNKMMQGQSSAGRRSSFQDRTVAGGAAARQKLHGALLWETVYGRLGRLMLSNSRQSLSQESFLRIIGLPSKKAKAAYEKAQAEFGQMMQQLQAAMNAGQPIDPATLQGLQPPVDPMQPLLDRYAEFQGTPEEVICGDDYMVYDNSQPQDKAGMAQALQELLSIAMQNPDVATRLDISAMALLDEMLRLRNAGPASRFSLKKRIAEVVEAPPQPSPEEIAAQQQAAAAAQQAQQPQTQGQPDVTNAPQTHVTHAPVVHIHNPKA